MRAEAAANALGSRPEGAFALARALLAVRDGERAALLARLLRPRVRALAEAGKAGPAGKKLAKALLANALARIGGRPGRPRRCCRWRARSIATRPGPACGRWRRSCRSERDGEPR